MTDYKVNELVRTKTDSCRQDGQDRHLYIPPICQFWYTAILFRLTKSTPKSASICDKVANISQNRPIFSAFSILNSTPARKKHTTAVVAVVTYMSSAFILDFPGHVCWALGSFHNSCDDFHSAHPTEWAEYISA